MFYVMLKTAGQRDEAIAFLRKQGVTYIFNGSNGYLINTDELDASPHFELLYSQGRTAIYRLLDR